MTSILDQYCEKLHCRWSDDLNPDFCLNYACDGCSAHPKGKQKPKLYSLRFGSMRATPKSKSQPRRYNMDKYNSILAERGYSDRREALHDLYCNEKSSLREIGTVFGVNKNTIKVWMRDLGLPVRKNGGVTGKERGRYTTRRGLNEKSKTMEILL